MLKHEIVLLVTYQPQHWRVLAGDEYRFLGRNTIFDKIVAKKWTPYGKIIPRAPVTTLKHEIVLLVTYQPPTLKGGGLQKALILLTQIGAFYNLLNQENTAF